MPRPDPGPFTRTTDDQPGDHYPPIGMNTPQPAPDQAAHQRVQVGTISLRAGHNLVLALDRALALQRAVRFAS
jgi:hypothetical protein